MNNASNPGLLARQWSHYTEAHADRKNLLVHALTVPLFLAGTLALLSSFVAGPRLALGGLFAMALAIAAQGRGHRHETTKPAPFHGALDIVVRLFAEQWITFPRFVLSGGFGRSLRSAR